MTTVGDALRAEADRQESLRQESFDRCDTDGFLSQWAHGLTAELRRREADIADNGGQAEFPALFTLTGERVRAKQITGSTYMAGIGWRRWTRWAFCDSNDRFTGQFISAGLLPRNMERKGYREGTEMAPAKAVIQGSGYGLSGSAWVTTVRTDKGYPAGTL